MRERVDPLKALFNILKPDPGGTSVKCDASILAQLTDPTSELENVQLHQKVKVAQHEVRKKGKKQFATPYNIEERRRAVSGAWRKDDKGNSVFVPDSSLDPYASYIVSLYIRGQDKAQQYEFATMGSTPIQFRMKNALGVSSVLSFNIDKPASAKANSKSMWKQFLEFIANHRESAPEHISEVHFKHHSSGKFVPMMNSDQVKSLTSMDEVWIKCMCPYVQTAYGKGRLREEREGGICVVELLWNSANDSNGGGGGSTPAASPTLAYMRLDSIRELGRPTDEVLMLTHFVGKKVAKYFPGFGTFLGTVRTYLPPLDEEDVPLWHVQYDDGDEEDFNIREIYSALQEHDRRMTVEEEKKKKAEIHQKAMAQKKKRALPTEGGAPQGTGGAKRPKEETITAMDAQAKVKQMDLIRKMSQHAQLNLDKQLHMRAQMDGSANSGVQDLEPDVFVAECLTNSKWICGRQHYLVKWKGFNKEDSSWEPSEYLSCPELVAAFEKSRQ